MELASRRDDPELLAAHRKPDRKRTHILAFNVEWNRGGAGKLDAGGLKMFHPARAVELVGEQPPAATDEAVPIDPRKDGDFQQTVSEVRAWKKRKASAVEATIAD